MTCDDVFVQRLVSLDYTLLHRGKTFTRGGVCSGTVEAVEAHMTYQID
jgi:hypothetical protein